MCFVLTKDSFVKKFRNKIRLCNSLQCVTKLYIDINVIYITLMAIITWLVDHMWRIYVVREIYIMCTPSLRCMDVAQKIPIMPQSASGWHITVRIRYNAVNCLQNPPGLAPEGEVWCDCCNSKIRLTFCHCCCSVVCNIVINWTAL